MQFVTSDYSLPLTLTAFSSTSESYGGSAAQWKLQRQHETLTGFIGS